MNEYALYLESGPRKRTTMVHVLDLLGCIVRGPTTEAALKTTPAGIKAYLRFLEVHGDGVDPDAAFTTVVKEHVMEGPWLGNGNPTPGFGPDFQVLEVNVLDIYLSRMDWLLEDLLELIHDLPSEQQLTEPEGIGRSIFRIVEHLAESQHAYLRSILGPMAELPAALRVVRARPEALPDSLVNVWKIIRTRLEAMTDADRALSVQRGQVTWTAKRALRRLLEHPWEHLMEIAERLGKPMA
jgi:uncharacterized damage-inducible protein DinB